MASAEQHTRRCENGDGVADIQITITNPISLANLTAIDFIL